MTQYEVETMLNGKHRDFNVDAKGKLVVVEEEVDIAGIPAAAKAAIEKKMAGGKLNMVETVDQGRWRSCCMKPRTPAKPARKPPYS